ncbi:MAG TPA: hypothetical protein VFU15_10750, partial [Bacteroidia bacterium]|nr:hypothetical protein [Bacteroidia bacterium]
MKQRLPAFLLIFLFPVLLSAGNKYWTAGSGNWNDPAHWSESPNGKGGAGIPSVNDDIFIGTDVSSEDADTVTIDGKANCRNFNYGDGVNANKIVLRGNGEISVHGSLLFTHAFNDLFTGTWNFSDPAAGVRDNSLPTITTNNHVFSGKLVFISGPGPQRKNIFLANDNLFVNNSIGINSNSELILSDHTELVANEIILNGTGSNVTSRPGSKV